MFEVSPVALASQVKVCRSWWEGMAAAIAGGSSMTATFLCSKPGCCAGHPVPSFMVNLVVQARVILMLGAKDRRVPPPDGQQYAAALRAAGASPLAEHVGY
jgi:hypothetical protein